MKITLDVEGIDNIKKKIGDASLETALFLAEEVRRTTDPFVPMRSGSLAIRAKTDTRPLSDRAKEATEQAIAAREPVVIYPGPYARYLYNGVLYVDPATGSSWAKKGHTKVPTSKPLQISTAAHQLAQSHWFEASKALNMDKWGRAAQKYIVRQMQKK